MLPSDPNDPEPIIPLSKGRILRTALRLADEDGIEALSMRKIAEKLDVTAMSLYHHVENKDEIIDGIVDLVISEMDVPQAGDDWKAAMRSRALSAHEVLLRHPWAIATIVRRINVGPAMIRYINGTLGCLVEAGFSYAMADQALNAMESHIYGFTLQELNFPIEPSEYAHQAENFLPTVPTQKYPYFTQLAKLVSQGQYSGVNDFTFGLDLILDGLEEIQKHNQN